MNTQIVWRQMAFDRMDEIVRAFPERTAEFASALKGLTLALTPNPEQAGESREPPYRVIVCDPLTFRFRPATAEDAVYVVWVHLHGHPSATG